MNKIDKFLHLRLSCLFIFLKLNSHTDIHVDQQNIEVTCIKFKKKKKNYQDLIMNSVSPSKCFVLNLRKIENKVLKLSLNIGSELVEKEFKWSKKN